MENRNSRCPDAALLARYAAGDLGDWEAAEVDAHLAECDPCALEASEMRRSAALWTRLMNPLVPVFDALAAGAPASPAMAAALRALGGRIWSVALLVYEAPRKLPRLALAPTVEGSPFGPFMVPVAPTRTRGARAARRPAAGGAREIAVAAGEGHCRLLLSVEKEIGKTFAVLENWTRGDPPRAVAWAASSGNELRWEKTGPGKWRVEIPGAGGSGEVALAIGPPGAALL